MEGKNEDMLVDVLPSGKSVFSLFFCVLIQLVVSTEKAKLK